MPIYTDGTILCLCPAFNITSYNKSIFSQLDIKMTFVGM